MSWAVGFDTHWQRDIGYGVPAICDKPKCDARINRGLSFVCGGEPYGGEIGCGLYFCANHLWFGRSRNAPQLCPRCMEYRPPYKRPKSDVLEWREHKLTDESWQEWRDANPDKVQKLLEAK